MKIPQSIALAVLFAVISRASSAQYLAPVALNSYGSAPHAAGQSSGTDFHDHQSAIASTETVRVGTAPQRDINEFGLVAGGLAGGSVGLFLGGAIGASSASGCHGEWCAVGPTLIGALVGESVLMAVGAHFVSGSARNDRIAIGTVSALGITAAAVGVSLLARDGSVILPLAPIVQLATLYFIESH